MQKMKKVLISLLACLCVGTVACGFAACKDDEATGTGTGTGNGGILGGLGGNGTQTGGDTGSSAQVMVVYEANGGEFANATDAVQVVTANTTLTTPTPTRNGYVLKGWALNEAGTIAWDSTQKVTTNVTLYAVWKKAVQEYDVRFNLNYDGAETVTLSTEEGKVTYVPEREGYVFKGWWEGSNLTTKFNTNNLVTSSGLELYAEWVEADKASAYLSAPVITVTGETFTWEAVEGAASYDVQVLYNSSYAYSTTEYDTSWDFYGGGYGNGVYTVQVRANGDGETKINSSYNSVSYRYHMLDSVTGISLDPFTSLLTWNGVQNADYYELYIGGSYVGCFYETKYDMSGYSVGSYNVTIYAYDYDGYQSSYNSAYVNKLKLNTPSGLCCSFDLEDNEYTFSWTSVYNANSYELSLNGDVYTTSSTSYTINGDYINWNEDNQVLYSVKAKDSYNNYLKSDASYEYTQDKVIVASVTVNNSISVVNDSYRVTFDKNDGNGTVYNTQYVTETDGLDYPTIPTLSGYVFTGWYMEASCDNLYDFTSAVTGDMTLYAGWHYMNTSGYGNYVIDPFYYNSSSNPCSFTTYGSSSSDAQYRYFQFLTSGTYTLYYRNYYSSSGYYNTYFNVYNATQDLTIYDNSLIGYSSSYSYFNITANAGDVIYIRTYRYYYNYSSNFYFYITGAQMPADGGYASGIDYTTTTETTDSTTTYYAVNDYATISANLGNAYTFDGWYNENDEWVSNDRDYGFYVTEENVTYTAKWSVYKSRMGAGTSFTDAIVAYSGASYDVVIDTAGEWKYFVFTPMTSGSYSFYSDNLNGDSHVYLYDSNCSLLTENDDYSGLNFRVSYTLTAGYTYYIKVGEHNGDATCSFTFHIAMAS